MQIKRYLSGLIIQKSHPSFFILHSSFFILSLLPLSVSFGFDSLYLLFQGFYLVIPSEEVGHSLPGLGLGVNEDFTYKEHS